MAGRRVAFRQCDLTRALKAAKAAGAKRVVVRLDGSIAIEVEREEDEPAHDDRWPAGKRREIVF